jgi:NAD(P)-dependent dehydrogenase (short-subunit alcohol dehydrogenase family)
MLKGKNLLIFGNSSGIVRQILQKISDAEAKQMVFCPEENVDTINLPNLRVIPFSGHPDALSEQLKELTELKISFDGVVFAGGIGGVRPAKLNSDSFVRQMFERNVFAFLEVIRLLLKKRLLNEGASILALSSVSSIKGLKSKSVYSASKAALDASVRGIAAELSTKKIRVNSIQKGWVSSDMDLSFIKSNTAISKDDDFSRQLLGAIEPEELANLITFLLSDAVKTLTGQAIVLDGGYTL